MSRAKELRALMLDTERLRSSFVSALIMSRPRSMAHRRLGDWPEDGAAEKKPSDSREPGGGADGVS